MVAQVSPHRPHPVPAPAAVARARVASLPSRPIFSSLMLAPEIQLGSPSPFVQDRRHTTADFGSIATFSRASSAAHPKPSGRQLQNLETTRSLDTVSSRVRLSSMRLKTRPYGQVGGRLADFDPCATGARFPSYRGPPQPSRAGHPDVACHEPRTADNGSRGSTPPPPTTRRARVTAGAIAIEGRHWPRPRPVFLSVPDRRQYAACDVDATASTCPPAPRRAKADRPATVGHPEADRRRSTCPPPATSCRGSGMNCRRRPLNCSRTPMSCSLRRGPARDVLRAHLAGAGPARSSGAAMPGRGDEGGTSDATSSPALRSECRPRAGAAWPGAGGPMPATKHCRHRRSGASDNR